MAFRLKNKELQDKLDEISNGDFSKQINSIGQSLMATHFREFVTFGEVDGGAYTKKFALLCCFLDIEEVPEYNPHAWNDFPTVTPPENVPMRIEVKRIGGKDHGSTFPFYGYFKDSEWIVLIRRSINKLLKEFSDFDPTYDKIRFRPWND